MNETFTVTPPVIEQHRDNLPKLANRRLGDSALVGLQVAGDKKISSSPYVRTGTEDAGHFIKVKGPNDAGQIVETEMPFDQALNNLSHRDKQAYTKPESIK